MAWLDFVRFAIPVKVMRRTLHTKLRTDANIEPNRTIERGTLAKQYLGEIPVELIIIAGIIAVHLRYMRCNT
ncbi:MAG: hypothetical protein PHS31_10660 [Victivallaceae bacterium]|nr:hypothetical protein [Victivallaceae bacterium]